MNEMWCEECKKPLSQCEHNPATHYQGKPLDEVADDWIPD